MKKTLHVVLAKILEQSGSIKIDQARRHKHSKVPKCNETDLHIFRAHFFFAQDELPKVSSLAS